MPGRLPFRRLVRVIDLSEQGLAVEASELLVPEETYRITLAAPEGGLALDACVVWCRLLGTRREGDEVLPIYRAGLRLAGDLPAEGQRLLSALEEGSSGGAGTRVHARFNVPDELTGSIGGEAPLEVRTLSSDGMALVMRHKPRLYSHIELTVTVGDREIAVEGRVADIIERGDEVVVGIELANLSPQARSVLDDYLARLAAEDDARP